MRLSATILGFAAAASLTFSPAFADSDRPATAGKPTTSTTTKTSGKPATTGKTTSTTSSGTTNSGSTATGTGAGTGTATGTGTTTTPLNPIAAKIASKPGLNSKVAGMLPIDPVTNKTMTLDKASMGFRNQGQFIAALHVSQNLGVSFTELKSHMVTVTPGTAGAQATASQTGSLGQAIQAVKKNANATTEVEKAETQTTTDLRNTTTTTSTTSPAKNKKKTTNGGTQ